jgi:hypothetical protein
VRRKRFFGKGGLHIHKKIDIEVEKTFVSVLR